VSTSQRFSQICAKEEYVPFFQVVKPAEVKINPYTGKPMQPQSIPYQDNQVTVAKIKSYILSNLPDFSININSA
jgi:hypothetical protein